MPRSPLLWSLIAGLILSSCSSPKVASDSFLQKRKYRKGFHVSLSAGSPGNARERSGGERSQVRRGIETPKSMRSIPASLPTKTETTELLERKPSQSRTGIHDEGAYHHRRPHNRDPGPYQKIRSGDPLNGNKAPTLYKEGEEDKEEDVDYWEGGGKDLVLSLAFIPIGFLVLVVLGWARLLTTLSIFFTIWAILILPITVFAIIAYYKLKRTIKSDPSPRWFHHTLVIFSGLIALAASITIISFIRLAITAQRKGSLL